MKPLVRTQVLDEPWSADDLDDTAEFWLRCYELLHGESGFPRDPDRSLEIIILGFPRFAGSGLVAELKNRLPESELARAEIDQPDADTICLSTTPRPSKHAPPRGLGLPLLVGLCDGFPIEIRFTLSGQAGRLIRMIRFSSTLVIHGELRDGDLLVKAIWRAGTGGWEDRAFRHEPSPEGGRFLRAFAEYRESGRLPTKRTARTFFRTGDVDFVGWLMQKAVRVPFDRFRLPGLLLRVAIHVVCITALSFLLDGLIEYGNWLAVLAVSVWLVIPAIAVGFFYLIEFLILLKSGRYLRTLFARHFEESRLLPLSPAEAADRLDDPNVRKLTAELLDAKFTHLGDVLSALNDGDGTLLRIFADPNRSAVVVLGCIAKQDFGPGTVLHFWPRAIGMQIHTFFKSGGRMETATAAYAYRRQRPGPDSLIRFVPDVDDPIELHRQHVPVAEAFAKERSLEPLPAGRLDEFLRRLEQIRDEDRRHFQEHGIGRLDHLRWYLQWPRKEARG